MLKKVILLLCALLVFAGLLRLGFWQLSRAEQKLNLQLQTEQKQAAETIDLNMVGTLTPEHRFRNVEVKGVYLPEKQILIDNQIIAGKVGYYLLTPLKLINSERIILVNRGWLTVGEDRSVLPEVETPEEMLTIKGRLNAFPAKPLMWKDSYQLMANNVWQYLPIKQYQQKMQIKVQPLLIELAPEPNDEELSDSKLNKAGGYVRQWRTIKTDWVNRHKAYAMQWFSLAIAFLVCCTVVVIQSFSKKNSNGR